MNRPAFRTCFVRSSIGLLTCLLVSTGCSPSQPLLTHCEDAMGIHAICGFQNPEDLALLPDQRRVVVSQFGAMDGARPGNLGIFDLETEAFEVVYTGGDNGAESADEVWGDPLCPAPPSADFSPHGLDLATNAEGALQLLVVNHGGRESIEFFEVTGPPEQPDLIWRGCVIAPENTSLNDVVHLPGGGFLTTHMFPQESHAFGMVEAALGLDTGLVLEWNSRGGWTDVPGTKAPFPNGIEISDDGRLIYLNSYMAGEVRRIDRVTGEQTGVANVSSPDNSSWSQDGRLLVASHEGGIADQVSCYGLLTGACPMAFKIVAIDPETFETQTLFRNEGPPMGAGTIAIDTGSELLMGSFAGDRMIRVPLKNEKPE